MCDTQYILSSLFAMKALAAYKQPVLAAYGVAYVHDLNEQQLDEAIALMEERKRLATTPVSEEVRKARSLVLKQLMCMGIHTNVDWNRTNVYLLHKRICGKLLFECSLDELKALLKKLRAIGRKYKTRADLDNFLAANN